MAFAFGDSYLKLPPITTDSAAEIDGESSNRSPSSLVRDQHGLVRLPPIVRLDSLRSAPSSAKSFPSGNETHSTTTTDYESEMTRLGSSLKITQKTDILRQGSSKKVRKYPVKREDETKLINETAAKETDGDETRFIDSEDQEKEKAGFWRLKEKSRGLRVDNEAMPLYKDSMVNRRGSATFKKGVKLTRSRRLAKSSPELCNRKINWKHRAGGNVIETTGTFLSPENCSRTSQARLSVHDIDGSVLSHLQNTVKNDEKTKREKRTQSQKAGSARKPKSSPNSPVCSESANREEHKQKGRKSLNDITETVKQFIDRRRPSISPPKKQNLIEDASGLKIEGKSCSQSEKGEVCPPTISHADSLYPPQQNEKRHSLYDLQQILTLLQREDLKRQASSTASSPRSASAASNASDSNKTSNGSVYDLREFLTLTAAAEASSGRQMKKPSTNKLSAGKTLGGSSLHLLSPNRERENLHEGARKGSVYDLMEFLSLGSTWDYASASSSENSSRSASPRLLFSPRGVGGSNEMLSVTELGAADARRSSTYNLMEFLSLPRSGANSRPESGQSSASSQGDNSNSNAQENEERESYKQSKENRSLSVYDLAEFLSMTSGVPPLVRVTTSDEEQTENRAAASTAGEGERRDVYKRNSEYDLKEILNVMQQEHETKRESMYNLQEILSYFHQQAEEGETATGSGNAPDGNTKPLDSPSPPKTASSGYSSDSPSFSTDLNNLQANDSTNARQMSGYDLKEFLSLYAAQQSAPSQQIPSWFSRKVSSASQSGISIHVTDESNRSLDLETDEVFLPVPGSAKNASSTARKRGSTYDLREFLNMLNANDSPLRRRLSSVSSSSSKSSESEPEFNPHPSQKPDGYSNGSGVDANERATAPQSRPQLSPRQDSGGNVSLYDLGEFLSLLNTDESPLRRRLSSAGDIPAQGEPRTPRNDSEKSPLYSLEEILTVLNDLEQKKSNENSAGESEVGSGEEISISVPLLPPRNEKTNSQPLAPKKRLSSQKSLKSVPETPELKARLSL